MTDRDKRFVEYWEKQRAKGIVKFSIVTGITYGIFVVVFSKVFAWNLTFSQRDILYGIFSILVGITALAPFMWWHRNRKYDKIKMQNSSKKNKTKSKKS